MGQRPAGGLGGRASGARFIGRLGGFWTTPQTAQQVQALADTLRRTVAELHHAQPTLVVQAAVFEVIEP